MNASGSSLTNESFCLPLGLTAFCVEDFDGSLVFALTDPAGREVGAAVLVTDGYDGFFSDIWIVPRLRQKGVATALYDAIEERGIFLRASDELDEVGACFWAARCASMSTPPFSG